MDFMVVTIYLYLENNQMIFSFISCAYSEGGGEDPDPLKNHKSIGFGSNTGPDPLKITKLQSQPSRLAHHQHANETPFNDISLAS